MVRSRFLTTLRRFNVGGHRIGLQVGPENLPPGAIALTREDDMQLEYRSPTEEEWPAFGSAVSRGFGNHPPTDDHSRQRWERFYPFARPIGAWDGEQVVGTSGSFVSDTTVPGGTRLPAALVTIVTVAATHRRRGVLTNIMRRTLEAAHERGEPFATLWASESVIYGRFGYGMAGQHYASKIRAEKANVLHVPEVKGIVRFADRARVRKVGPEIWKRVSANRPGMPDRSERGWESHMPVPDEKDKPEKRRFYAVYEEDGQALGYVEYKTTDVSNDGESDVAISELLAVTDGAHAALWRFILNIDLVANVRYDLMPVDDPIWWMLDDPRRLKRTPYDAIWLRLLDVEKSLSARTYSEATDLVISVEDDFCPWVAGNYRLTTDASGNAGCVRTENAADIVVPAASLATCYFGSVKFADLARAGRAGENTPGALLQADRAFATEREPWCPLEY